MSSLRHALTPICSIFNSYKSKNADDNPRYTPYTIKDVSNASPVEASALNEMTVSVPKPKRKVTIDTVPERRRLYRIIASVNTAMRASVALMVITAKARI